MTHNEKKSLYESIMKDVSHIVKNRINEESDEILRIPESDTYSISIPKSREMAGQIMGRCHHLLCVLDDAPTEKKKYILKLVDAFCEFAEQNF